MKLLEELPAYEEAVLLQPQLPGRPAPTGVPRQPVQVQVTGTGDVITLPRLQSPATPAGPGPVAPQGSAAPSAPPVPHAPQPTAHVYHVETPPPLPRRSGPLFTTTGGTEVPLSLRGLRIAATNAVTNYVDDRSSSRRSPHEANPRTRPVPLYPPPDGYDGQPYGSGLPNTNSSREYARPVGYTPASLGYPPDKPAAQRLPLAHRSVRRQTTASSSDLSGSFEPPASTTTGYNPNPDLPFRYPLYYQCRECKNLGYVGRRAKPCEKCWKRLYHDPKVQKGVEYPFGQHPNKQVRKKQLKMEKKLKRIQARTK